MYKSAQKSNFPKNYSIGFENIENRSAEKLQPVHRRHCFELKA